MDSFRIFSFAIISIIYLCLQEQHAHCDTLSQGLDTHISSIKNEQDELVDEGSSHADAAIQTDEILNPKSNFFYDSWHFIKTLYSSGPEGKVMVIVGALFILITAGYAVRAVLQLSATAFILLILVGFIVLGIFIYRKYNQISAS